MNQTVIEDLRKKIQNAYESSITIDDAEKLAAEFLSAMIIISRDLAHTDLNSRMHKSGLKAVRAKIRTDEIAKYDKKPTEGQLEDVLALSPVVKSGQEFLDSTESDRDYLQNILDIFREAHIYFRGISKGRYDT